MDIYEKLTKAVDELPKEAVERAKKEITRKGYDTTGFQYQYLVNVLNENLGLGNWGFSYLVIKEIEGQWANGKRNWEITTEVTIWIKADEKIEFTCVGGHKSDLHADALKGAITNGFKKTVAFFGVGKKAYEGTLDDDYRPISQNGSKPPLNAPQSRKESQEVDLGPEPEKGEQKPDVAEINRKLKEVIANTSQEDIDFILGKLKLKSVKDIKTVAKAQEFLNYAEGENEYK